MKHYCLLLIICMLSACGRSDENNDKHNRVHLVVNSGTIDQGNWEQISAPMAWWINIHGDEKLYVKDTKEFTREQRLSFAAYTYLNDVVKEGHQWFFTNTANVIQLDVLEGLKEVGFSKHVVIYYWALQKYVRTVNREADFTEEDTGLILLRENEDLEQLFQNYAKANSARFYYDQWVSKPE